jgi:hypothetical protein
VISQLRMVILLLDEALNIGPNVPPVMIVPELPMSVVLLPNVKVVDDVNLYVPARNVTVLLPADKALRIALISLGPYV